MQLDVLRNKCQLCPHECNLAVNELGKCLIRKGSLEPPYSSTDGFQVSTIAIEPLSKKPILHYPNAEDKTLSVGGYGCSMSCDYCQNWKVSQNRPKRVDLYKGKELAAMALAYGVKKLCFTYNEPTLYYPHIVDLYKFLHKEEMELILKTNAYVNYRYWIEILNNADVMNIDYKGSEARHMEQLGIRQGTYDVILENIKDAIDSKCHIEISVPVFENYTKDDLWPLIKTINDCKIGNVPIHLLRVFPVNRLKGNPTERDTVETFRTMLLNEIDNHSGGYDKLIHIHNVYGK